jgi:hydroxymethylbilane synthase
MLAGLEDLPTRCEVEAERAFLKAMGGSCRVPIGALGRAQDDHLTVEAVVLSPDGQRAFKKSVSGSVRAAKKLGIELASHLRAVGADRLLYGAWAAKK